MDAKYRSKEIVWGKIQPYPWWPGKIINIHIQCNEIIYKILFFADPTFAYLPQSQLCSFLHLDPQSNAHYPHDPKLQKAIRLADEAYFKNQQFSQSQYLKMSLQHKKTSAKSLKQPPISQPKQRKQNIVSNNSNQSQQLPPPLQTHCEQQKIKRQQSIVSVGESQSASENCFLNLQQVTKENIIEILQKRICNRQKFQYNYENRKRIIQHKISLKRILLQRYNLYQPLQQVPNNQQVTQDGGKQNSRRRGLKRVRMGRRKTNGESMARIKDKCIRRLYNLCKGVLNGHNSTFNIKELSLNLIKRISQLSEQNETKYKSLLVTLIKSIESRPTCRSKPFDQRIGEFNTYLEKLQNQKQQDEQGSKMTQISTINP